MDLKGASDAVGLIASVKELKDKITGKAEIRNLEAQVVELEAQLQEKDVELQKLSAGEGSLGSLSFSTEQLAVIGISAVTIVAIIAILVLVMRSQAPAMIQA